MPLVKGSTYENVFYDFVLDGTRDLLVSEFSNAMIYIAPKILHDSNFQIRLWGTEASTEDWGASHWKKLYNVEISVYMVENKPTEPFYQQFYGTSERVYQLIHNNKTKSITVGSTTLTWINGKVDDIEYGDLADEEEDVTGLNKSTLSFNCLIEREG